MLMLVVTHVTSAHDDAKEQPCILPQYEEAEQMYRQAQQLMEKVLGQEHPDTLGSMNNLASVLGSQGKYAEAEGMHRQALQLREKVLGQEHPDTLTSMNNLAEALRSQATVSSKHLDCPVFPLPPIRTETRL
jgi:tetratricopeptide (TPR) repeat protein